MPKQTSKAGGELFIVDNRDQDWNALRYLREWGEIAKALDIATGYFDIGSLIRLDGSWRKIDAIRLLMGAEVSEKTAEILADALEKLDDSLEAEKRDNPLLSGAEAVIQAMRTQKLRCRIYDRKKFHAKCYITRGRLEVVGSHALVGSSNMTVAGLTQNIELNVKVEGPPVAVLQEWYEERWNEGREATAELLRVLERHAREYPPFDIYAKALASLYGRGVPSLDEWENAHSRIYPCLAQYQKDGYRDLLKKAARWRGAFLCDGVGLGKTFVGLMLIERLVGHDRRRVALFAPKSVLESVWLPELDRRLPELRSGRFRTGMLECFAHTDLGRDSCRADMRAAADRAEVVIIDEGHNFRNTGIRGGGDWEGKSRYWRMREVCRDKTVFLLTATPINNSLNDFRHMMELFTGGEEAHFKEMGVHSLSGHFRKLEKVLEKPGAEDPFPKVPGRDVPADINLVAANSLLQGDPLFRELVVQRSRAYVKKDAGGVFPEARQPKVAPYSLEKTYGPLLKGLEREFDKKEPLFSLPPYRPDDFLKNGKEKDDLESGRQRQVVSLIRTQFLKRFESSAEAFSASSRRLLAKLLAWMERHADRIGKRKHWERWKKEHVEILMKIGENFTDKLGQEEDVEAPETADLFDALDPEKYDLGRMYEETMLDMEGLIRFIGQTDGAEKCADDKFAELCRLLAGPELKGQKVLIFSEFMDTTVYLEKRLRESGFENVEELHSSSGKNRGDVIRRFSPCYNGSSSDELRRNGEREIAILVSTDVLSEGLNLQDCRLLINYDLHWNPVRLMQRIGRVDRRRNPEIEAALRRDHPEDAAERGRVSYWNFLPPAELDRLLGLYQTVTRKTLRISRLFGIEGGKLLTPDDDFEALRDFIGAYEGEVSPKERLHMEFEELARSQAGLIERLDRMPKGVWSGRARAADGRAGVFFCYALPGPDG
ncbi:MAG: phospholipase D-like domain-containing protein, partial [Planctomycetota bacterium]|nr:phospholipase D-like domain-containing protein [Planctomycetota bacterium]